MPQHSSRLSLIESTFTGHIVVKIGTIKTTTPDREPFSTFIDSNVYYHTPRWNPTVVIYTISPVMCNQRMPSDNLSSCFANKYERPAYGPK